MQLLSMARRPGKNPCRKTESSLVITKKGRLEAPNKSYISSSFGKPPQSSPWLYKYTVKQRTLLLSPVMGSICSTALLILTSFLSKWGYGRQRWNCTCAGTVQQDGTVRSLPRSHCSYCSCWLEINESLAAGLSSEITDLAEQQKPFSSMLKDLDSFFFFMLQILLKHQPAGFTGRRRTIIYLKSTKWIIN